MDLPDRQKRCRVGRYETVLHIFSVAQLKPGFKSSLEADVSVLSKRDVEMHIHWPENCSIPRIWMH